MTRVVGWINVVAGFCLLSLILSGVFSRLLTNIADWNQFETIAGQGSGLHRWQYWRSSARSTWSSDRNAGRKPELNSVAAVNLAQELA